MKNASLLERMCQCLPGAVSTVMKADGQIHSSALCGFALTSYFAHTSPSSHTATSLSFFMAREQEFPHDDMLAKLAGLAGAFNFFTQIFFSIRGKRVSPSVTS